jgi:hypothetical protein
MADPNPAPKTPPARVACSCVLDIATLSREKDLDAEISKFIADMIEGLGAKLGPGWIMESFTQSQLPQPRAQCLSLVMIGRHKDA